MSERQTQVPLAFFRLTEQPFAPTADPAYFYATREHRECLFRLWTSIDEQHGIAVVLGNYGSGKTTLLRKLLTGMAADPYRYSTAVIGSPIPSWTSFALLESIVTQFGLSPAKRSFVSYMEALNQFLLSNRNRINTLVIDDAQNLNKRGQLELLRLVQNLETPQHKLLNLICFAQLEWTSVLQAAPNFEQRINMTYTLSPLDFQETRNLVEFRLHQAGTQGDAGPVFDEASIRLIQAYSDGNPRVTVTLCRNVLLVGAQIRQRHIGREIVVHTIEKTTLPDPAKRARLAAALLETSGLVVNEAGPGVREPGPRTLLRRAVPERRVHPQEDRASRLLLKAARLRQANSDEGH